MIATIRVLIVEDDFMVADINRQATELVEGFSVVKVALNAQEELSALEAGGLDLVVLDVYLPDSNGMDFLKEVRRRAYPVDFILITAAQDTSTVEESIRYGVIDYLIKPFDLDRYKRTLSEYRKRRLALSSAPFMNQVTLDAVLDRAPSGVPEFITPKGISPLTLAKITEFIEQTQGEEISTRDLEAKYSLSRITARRYLEFLADSGMLRKEIQYQKVGRPRVLYQKKAKP